jgi:hypothetical protein
MDSGQSTQSSVIDSRSIRELPLLGRSYDSLATLVPGTIAYGPGAGVSFEFSAGRRFSAAGGRGYTNSFLLDGTNINDHANGTPGNASGRNPGIEALREFTVLTETYKAEYGRASGAIIAAATRSGTNQLHGSAYAFHLNSAVSASGFFENAFGVDQRPFRANQFGAALGGPIRRNRTFIFGNYEGWRQGLGRTTAALVPDQNAKQGLLPSGLPGQFRRVPIAPGISPFLSLYPDPNGQDFGSGVGLFFNSSTLATNGDYFLLRGDHQLTENISLFGRYSFDDDSRVTPQPIPVFEDVLSARRQYSTIQLTYALWPNLLNSFRFAYNRSAQFFDSVPTVPLPSGTSFVAGQPMGLLQVATGLTAIDLGSNANAPRQWVFNLFQWGDDLSYIRGRHAFKFGGNLEGIRDNMAENTLARGSVLFTTLPDLLQDRPARFLFSSPAYRGFRQSVFAFYGQDDVRLSSRLTLNLGLRWEAVTDPTEAHGRISNIISPPLDSVQVLDKFINVSKKNFEPRAGIAWQLSGKTVLRAGAGIYHDQLLPFIYARNSSKMPPFFGRVSIDRLPLLSFIPISAAVQPNLSVISFTTMNWQSQTPTKYQYNLAVEQQLWKGAVVELAYIGSSARHLWGRVERNGPSAQICGDPSGCISGGLGGIAGRGRVPQGTEYIPVGTRPNPLFSSVQLLETDYSSNYNAFQVTVRRASASGLQFQGSYTFSRALDESTAMAAGDIADLPFTTLNPNDRRRDRGLSALHAQHHSVFYASYPFPFRSGNRALALLIQSWKVNAIGTFTSGRPFTVPVGFSRSGNGDPNTPDRPNLRPGSSNNPTQGVSSGPPGLSGRKLGTPELWFDPFAFTLPLPGTYGTLGRNTLIGPGFATLDFSVEKGFAVRENLQVQFRAEFFNLTNRANFGLPFSEVFNPNGFVEPQAGLITNTISPPRQIQFGLKILF